MNSNLTLVESYTLPSQGKVYNNVKVNPCIKLRSMTTNEEMKRLSHSDKPYAVIAEIIDDCLVENPGISAYDMCLGDYQFLLHRLRVVTYGNKYNTVTKCPYCYSTNEKAINLDDIEVREYTADIEKYMEFDLPITKKHIRIRMQTPRMLDFVATKTKEFNKKSKSSSGDAAFLFTIQTLIDTVDGERLDPIRLEEFVRKLPMMDTNYIIKYSDKLNEKVGINPILETDCDYCGLTYKNPFRITSEFFGPSIDI